LPWVAVGHDPVTPNPASTLSMMISDPLHGAAARQFSALSPEFHS
jgi:hypothetical protein